MARTAETDKKTEKEMENKREREGERGRDMVTHSSHAASSFDYSSKGGLKSEHFCTLTHKALAFLRAGTQEENPLTLPGLLQILAGLSCKAGRHTETAGFNTVTLVCTLSSLPEANALLLDILVYSNTLIHITSSSWANSNHQKYLLKYGIG